MNETVEEIKRLLMTQGFVTSYEYPVIGSMLQLGTQSLLKELQKVGVYAVPCKTPSGMVYLVHLDAYGMTEEINELVAHIECVASQWQSNLSPSLDVDIGFSK